MFLKHNHKTTKHYQEELGIAEDELNGGAIEANRSFNNHRSALWFWFYGHKTVWIGRYFNGHPIQTIYHCSKNIIFVA